MCGYNEEACDTSDELLGPEDSCRTERYRCNGINTGCCTVRKPCGKADGDCDSDAECIGDLKCGTDNCDQSAGSFIWNDDCCE